MDNFSNFLRALGPGRIMAMLGVTASLIGFFFFMIMQLSQPQMSLLYSNLELEESATVMQRLDALNVPYQLQNNGATIFVPRERISMLRVSLAGEGLGGSITGYEIFDRSDTLGTTSFVQNINRIRAIEGELARTLKGINSINSARVHIAMPERQLFQREDRSPTASIVLRTNSAGLARSQVRAIQYMVAAAVPGLDAESISIVDQTGALLARGGKRDANADYASNLEERRLSYESRVRNQIEDLLGNTVGMGHVRAEVSVQMNRERTTTNSETYDPDSQVVRSSKTIEEILQSRESTPGGEVTVGNNLPDAQVQTANPAIPATSSTERTDTTTNFEISKTVTVQIKEAGEIEKITVAVLVDGTYADDADGNPIYQPRSEDELDKLEALVRSAIGFDADRGDTIEMVNLQFIELEAAPPAEPPFNLLGLTKDDLFRILTTFVWGAVGILVLLLIVRPLIRRLIDSIPSPEAVQAQIAGQPGAQAAIAGPTGEAAQLDPEALAAASDAQGFQLAQERAGIDAQIDVASVEGRVQDSALKKVGDIVSNHPDEAASIVRGWLYSD